MPFSPLRHVDSRQLTNGIRLLFKEDHAWPLLSLHAWVRVGSVDEEPSQAGISHILEHMVFKGTAHFRAADISRWIESLGGAINAETTKEYTHYYIDVPASGGKKAAAILGELLHQASLASQEWDRERPVILEEIKRRNDDPEAALWDLLNEAIFPEERLRRPVIGSPETVGRMSRDAIESFYRRYYTAGRTLIVAVGDFKTRQMESWIASACGGMPAGAQAPRNSAAQVAYTPRHLTLKKPVRQAYLAFGFPTPPAHHPDHEALDLLAAVLGEGRSSRLVRSLRDEKKLVWSVSAANLSQEGPGFFSIFAESSPTHRKRLRPAVEAILASLARKLPAGRELARAKRLIQSAWLQSFETYHQQASTLGLFALSDDLARLENYLPRILALTRGQLRGVAERYLKTCPLSSAVIEG